MNILLALLATVTFLSSDNLEAKTDSTVYGEDYKQAILDGVLTIKEADNLIKKYSHIIETHPDWYGGYSALATIYLMIEKYNESVHYSKLSLQKEANADAYHNLAIAFTRVSKYQLAIEAADKAFSLNKEYQSNLDFMTSTSRAYAEIGKLDTAKNLLAMLIANNPSVKQKLKANKDFIAIGHLLQARKSNSQVTKNIHSMHPSKYLLKANRLFAEGKKDDAIRWFYIGQIRYRAYLLANLNLDPSGDKALFNSLFQQIGPQINKYAAQNKSKWLNLIDEAIQWHSNNEYETLPQKNNEDIYIEALKGIEELKIFIQK
ncbi:MAG: hypothetical protein HWD86_01715 [Kangiellaceae bacterium]|nr:hypothetical protein [Kangiellaceae bacterium]